MMISKSLMDESIEKAIKNGGDFAELFIENTEKTEMYIKDGSYQSLVKKNISGIGIRIISKRQQFYAFTNDLSRNSILKCVDDLSCAIDGKSVNDRIPKLSGQEVKNILCHNNLGVRAVKQKKNYGNEICKATQRYHQIKQTEIVIWNSVQNVIIANSIGACMQDRRERSRLITSVIAEKARNIQKSSLTYGFLKGWDCLHDVDAELIGNICAEQAIELLTAQQCPTGKMPIVIAGGLGGAFFHEACGHSLEASYISSGNSEFSGKIGENIASSLVTMIDDGSIDGLWGTNDIDDEGMLCKKNILIENGILKGYLIDYLNSLYMGMPATGNARRESYCYAPTSRMMNTYIAAGNDLEEEIISSVNYGIYIDEFKGGSVNPLTGEFNVGILRGHLIKNGKLDRAIKGGTLIGYGSDMMKKIDRVGKNLIWSHGMCGARSGEIPVGIGQPMIRISEGTVGGTG